GAGPARALAGRVGGALGGAAEPLAFDECRQRHPAVDAPERLRVVTLEPEQAGRPVARMETASRARVNGVFVDVLAQRVDFGRGARGGPRPDARPPAAVT